MGGVRALCGGVLRFFEQPLLSSIPEMDDDRTSSHQAAEGGAARAEHELRSRGVGAPLHNTIPGSERSWSAEEDHQLREAYSHGANWKKISQLMGGNRSEDAIRDRWACLEHPLPTPPAPAVQDEVAKEPPAAPAPATAPP